MTEFECLELMVPPSKPRLGKPYGGVIQIHVTRACDLACYNCTQGSQLGGRTSFMTPEQLDLACRSLQGYFGVIGVFGGNPCLSPHFGKYCQILQKHFPKEKCGLWSNNINGHGAICRATFNPVVSNLNVHLKREAYDEIKRTWPEARPFGLTEDSRHSPCYVAMRDVLRKPCPDCGGKGWTYNPSMEQQQLEASESTRKIATRDVCQTCGCVGEVYDESKAYDLISNCDINQHWSALVGVFRGEVRAWFCEIAGAQSMLHQYDENWQQWDTGLKLDKDGLHQGQYDTYQWWKLGMPWFTEQVRQHCHSCSVPLRGFGELAQSSSPESREQVSATHQSVYKPKRKDRKVELVVLREQLGQPLEQMTKYLGNSHL